MNKTIKHEDTWYLFQDGTIGVLTLDEKVPAIASGEPGNYTAYDYHLTAMRTAIKIGPVSRLPNIEAAIKAVRKIHRTTRPTGTGGQSYHVEKECARVHEITGRFLKNAAL